jgi:hypothetical protein
VPAVLEKNNDLDCMESAREHKHDSGALFNKTSKARIERDRVQQRNYGVQRHIYDLVYFEA